MAADYRTRIFRPLIGQPISAVETIEDGEAVRFTLTDGRTLTYHADGGCCSQSWIEHLTVPAGISGQAVQSVAESDPVEVDDPKHECLQVYQTTFQTPAGEIVVEYRNSSNGYYGGYLAGPSEAPA